MKYQKASLPEWTPPAKLRRARTISACAIAVASIIAVVLLAIRVNLGTCLALVIPSVIVTCFFRSLIFYLLGRRAIKQSGSAQRLPIEMSSALLVWSVLLAVLLAVLIGMIILFSLAIAFM